MYYVCRHLKYTQHTIQVMRTTSANSLMAIFGTNLIVFNVLNLGLLCNLLERDLNPQRYKKYSIAQTGVIVRLSLLLKTFFRQLSDRKKSFSF